MMRLKYLILLIAIIWMFNLFLSIYIFGTYDVKAWIRLAGVTNSFGLINGFNIYNASYPPAASIILWVVGKIFQINAFPAWISEYPTISEIGITYIYVKIVIFIFLFLFSILTFNQHNIFSKTSKDQSLKYILYVLANPAFILNASVLGYIDIFNAAPLLLSMGAFLLKKYFLAGILLSLTFSIKLIPIFLVPVFISYFLTINLSKLKITFNRRGIQSFILGITIIILPLLYYFGYDSIELIFRGSAAHGYVLSNNATNVNLLISKIINTNTTPIFWIKWSRIVFYILCGISIFNIIIRVNKMQAFLYSCVFVLYSYFFIFTGAHENHIFPSLVAALSFYAICPNNISRIIFYNISLISFLNLFIYYWFGNIIRDGEFILLAPKSFNIHLLTSLASPIVSLYAAIFYIYLVYNLFRPNQKNSRTCK